MIRELETTFQATPVNPFNDSGRGFSREVYGTTRKLLETAITTGAWAVFSEKYPEKAELMEIYFGSKATLLQMARLMGYETLAASRKRLLAALLELRAIMPDYMQKLFLAEEIKLKRTPSPPLTPEKAKIVGSKLKERWRQDLEFRKQQMESRHKKITERTNHEGPLKEEINMWEIVIAANLENDLKTMVIKLGLGEEEFSWIQDFCEEKIKKPPSDRILDIFSLAVARLCLEHKLLPKPNDETEKEVNEGI